MLERRSKKRVAITAPITLCVDELEIHTRMINFSDDGALFEVYNEDREKISTDDLEKEATFVLQMKDGTKREYTGEIIRFFFKGEVRYIALRFWEPSRELPS